MKTIKLQLESARFSLPAVFEAAQTREVIRGSMFKEAHIGDLYLPILGLSPTLAVRRYDQTQDGRSSAYTLNLHLDLPWLHERGMRYEQAFPAKIGRQALMGDLIPEGSAVSRYHVEFAFDEPAEELLISDISRTHTIVQTDLPATITKYEPQI